MFKQLRSRKAYTFVEVLVSSLILAIVAAGVYAGVTSIRQPAAAVTEDLAAAHVATQVFERLRMDVDKDEWDNASSNIYPGSHSWAPITINNGMTYNVSYDVIADNSMGGIPGRYVTVTVEWN